MSIAISSDLQEFRSGMESLIARDFPMHLVMKGSEGRDVASAASKLWDELVALGALSMLPESWTRGVEGARVAAMVVLAEGGYGLLPADLLSSIGLAAPLLMNGEDGTVPARLLKSLGSGARCLTVFVSGAAESAAGGLKGRAILVLRPMHAEQILLAVSHGDDSQIFSIPIETPGVEVHPFPSYDPTRQFAEVIWDLPAADPFVIASGSGAADRIRDAVDFATLAVAADSIGGARRALSDAISFAKTRRQFGKAIAGFQAIRHLLVDTYVSVEHAAAAVLHAAHATESGRPDAELSVHVAKVLSNEAFLMASRNCVQVHGGMGFTRELPAHLYVKRSRVNERLMGGSAEHRRWVGES